MAQREGEGEGDDCLGCRGRGWKLRRSRRALVRGTLIRGSAEPVRVTCRDCDGSGHAA